MKLRIILILTSVVLLAFGLYLSIVYTNDKEATPAKEKINLTKYGSGNAHKITIDLTGKSWLYECQEWTKANGGKSDHEILVLLDDGNLELSCEELLGVFIGTRERLKRATK